MKILLTYATSELGRTVSGLLAPVHELTLTDLPEYATGGDGVVACGLGDDPSTDELVSGHDAVINVGHGGHFAGPSELIDRHTRLVYNLLLAARAAGIQRFVNLGTLRLLDDYPPHLTVTENWRPTPTTEPEILAAHLCEFVCREFGREGGIQVANLRLGFPVVSGGNAQSAGPAALSHDDLRAAIDAALCADLSIGAQSSYAPFPAAFRTIHVQSPAPGARFLLKAAESVLGLPNGEAAPE